MTVRIVSIVGARPQFIKYAAVQRATERARTDGRADIVETLVHTGQHYDDSMSSIFFEELHIPPADVNLGVGSGSHAVQTAKMMTGIERVLDDCEPHLVVVYGDTNSTLAGALVATKRHTPVVHVEAGLRSGNRRMPEEINRILTDHASECLLAPTSRAMENLRVEGLAAKAVNVGDVMYDAVLYYSSMLGARPDPVSRLSLVAGEFGLVTIHRAENTERRTLERILGALEEIASAGFRLVFPLHPRTRAVVERELGGWKPRHGLELVQPFGYLDNLSFMQAAGVVLTDSGGMQKEAFFLGTPCVTLREETEWEETVTAGANVLVGSDPDRIVEAARARLDAGSKSLILAGSPDEYFGAGDAADKTVDAVVAFAKEIAGGT